jgi:hypothetical protein
MVAKRTEPRERRSVLIPLDPEEALRALSAFERPRARRRSAAKAIGAQLTPEHETAPPRPGT